MNYTIEHIRAAFQAAKKGIMESDFIKYIEVHAHLNQSNAPAAKRGPEPGVKAEKAPKSAKKSRKGKRGAVGEAIKAFVTSKGKAGAKVSEVAQALKMNPKNITAYFYAKGNKMTYKKVAPATFALK